MFNSFGIGKVKKIRPMAFYLTLSLYILTVLAGLILMISFHRLPRKAFNHMAMTHGLLGAGAVLSFLARDGSDPNAPHYLLFAFIASGVLLSGLVWRVPASLPVRIYFGLFALTFPLFLFSPSMLVNFLLTLRYTDSLGKTFDLGNRYFLEEQQAVLRSKANVQYKLVRKTGIYRSTVCRDLDFSGRIDSVRVLEAYGNDSLLVRAYRIENTYVSTDIDSADRMLPLQPIRRNVIQRNL
jgi:hypothetical protein